MAEKDRRNARSTNSTLEHDEVDSRRPMVQVYHTGPVRQGTNPGPSVPSRPRRGVTEVDGAAPTTRHCRSPFDTRTADGILHECNPKFAGYRMEGSHGSRSYDELGNREAFAVHEDRGVGQLRTSWNNDERSVFQQIPAATMSCQTQESVTAQESSSSFFNPSSFPTDYLQDADLYGPPSTQSFTVGQDCASTCFVPQLVLDHTLSSSSSSCSSYHSASSLPSGSISGVVQPGHPMDSEQMEGDVGVDHMATGIASVQLDDVEMDDTETAANQETGNYAIRLARRLFQPNPEGDTLLHLAIIEGVSEPAILQLIEFYSRRHNFLNRPNNRFQTPLHLATMTRRDDVIVRLLQNGARRRVFDRNLNAPLHVACRQGDIGRVRMLHPAAVDHELEQELRVVAESQNNEGQSCLHVAAVNNHLSVVRYLVEDCRVNVNLKELRRGRTILHLAVEKKNLDLVRYLLNLPDSYELLVEDLTYDHYSALQMAQMTNQTQIVDLLLLAGAQQIMDVDTR